MTMQMEWLIRGTIAHAFKTGVTASMCREMQRTTGSVSAPASASRCDQCRRLVMLALHGSVEGVHARSAAPPKPMTSAAATERHLTGERERAERRMLWYIVIGATLDLALQADKLCNAHDAWKRLQAFRYTAALALDDRGDPLALKLVHVDHH
jgi:hypothetical protein